MAATVVLLAALASHPGAQSAPADLPSATLVRAPRLQFPGATDSNSPAYWLMRDGQERLHVINSSRQSTLAIGSSVGTLGAASTARFTRAIDGDRWIEAVIPDADGTLYGWYHNEPSDACQTGRPVTAPRIGAARSTDGGTTWRDLGIILQAPASTLDCDTTNTYFTGGVGDFSVVLDHTGTDLYFFFSSYHRDVEYQGVSVARMLWANRDWPKGRLSTWDSGIWRPRSLGRPIVPAARSWHDRTRVVDAFWGPSVHWNSAVNRWVMLLNRAKDGKFSQEGIYVAFATPAGFPIQWSAPQRILQGGTWYPQVIGIEHALGTDKQASARARFFMGGRSDYEILFVLPRGQR